MSNDPISALTDEDRAWLRKHGWKEPAKQAEWMRREKPKKCLTCHRWTCPHVFRPTR